LYDTDLKSSPDEATKDIVFCENLDRSRVYARAERQSVRVYRLKGWRRMRRPFVADTVVEEIYPERWRRAKFAKDSASSSRGNDARRSAAGAWIDRAGATVRTPRHRQWLGPPVDMRVATGPCAGEGF
jgi:hypothetical protein